MSRKKGDIAETLSVEFLSQRGFDIEHRNFSTRFGEIDIIATKDNVLHFIEVKARSSTQFGQPSEAVTAQKLEKIIKTSSFYPIKNRQYQFDIIEVFKNNLKLIENITL